MQNSTPRTPAAISETMGLVEQSVQRLHGWLLTNGWEGYDPYDIRGLPRFIHPKSVSDRALRYISRRSELLFPYAVRRIFRVRPAVNAKGMALFAEAYRLLYESTGHEPYLRRGMEALEWLVAHRNDRLSHFCWGYPFDWQSRVLIPKGTPSSVVSATAGHAFWGFYRMTGDARYLDVCRSICEFFINDLNIDHLRGNKLCFSYTPIDHFHVHNANLFAAEFLIRIGLETDATNYVDYGMRAVAYALSE